MRFLNREFKNNFTWMALALFALGGCSKCYTCTSQTEFGPLTREVCGKKKNVGALLNALESDTASPWVCEKN